jgi:hypothetical protein
MDSTNKTIGFFYLISTILLNLILMICCIFYRFDSLVFLSLDTFNYFVSGDLLEETLLGTPSYGVLLVDLWV